MLLDGISHKTNSFRMHLSRKHILTEMKSSEKSFGGVGVCEAASRSGGLHLLPTDGQPPWHERFWGDAPSANASWIPNAAFGTQIYGNWDVGAIVTNCQMMKEMLPHMPASPISFEPQSENEMKMTMEMAT